jgi:hypothetical protein
MVHRIEKAMKNLTNDHKHCIDQRKSFFVGISPPVKQRYIHGITLFTH